MKLMYWIDKLFDKLFPPSSARGEGLWHTVGFTGVEDGTEFKDASWDVDIRHCVAVGLVKKVTFLGGAVVAGDFSCDVWKDGEFSGDTLTCFDWKTGIFKGKHLDCGHWSDANGECVAETVDLNCWWSGKLCKAKKVEADSWHGGVCEANVAEIDEWENGVFKGGTLSVKKWKNGTFEGEVFYGKWYGGVWKGKYFKGIDLSVSGLGLAREK